MTQADNIDLFKTTDLKHIDMSELLSLYDATALELEHCAIHKPGEDVQEDINNGDNEALYFMKQGDILKSASRVPLDREGDIKNLLRLWLRELPSDEEYITMADNLILSLCHHFDVH